MIEKIIQANTEALLALTEQLKIYNESAPIKPVAVPVVEETPVKEEKVEVPTPTPVKEEVKPEPAPEPECPAPAVEDPADAPTHEDLRLFISEKMKTGDRVQVRKNFAAILTEYDVKNLTEIPVAEIPNVITKLEA